MFFRRAWSVAGAGRGLLAPAARREQRGAATAETVVVLPVLLVITLGLVWVLSLAATQVRVVDAAQETARAAARDEPAATAAALGRRIAPLGSKIRITDDGSTVSVAVVADVRGPGGLFRVLPAISVSATAVAAMESRS